MLAMIERGEIVFDERKPSATGSPRDRIRKKQQQPLKGGKEINLADHDGKGFGFRKKGKILKKHQLRVCKRQRGRRNQLQAQEKAFRPDEPSHYA